MLRAGNYVKISVPSGSNTAVKRGRSELAAGVFQANAVPRAAAASNLAATNFLANVGGQSAALQAGFPIVTTLSL
jgi:hypothetical protein